MVKQCGHFASDIIQSMCMFKVLGETICSMYSYTICFQAIFSKSSTE